MGGEVRCPVSHSCPRTCPGGMLFSSQLGWAGPRPDQARLDSIAEFRPGGPEACSQKRADRGQAGPHWGRPSSSPSSLRPPSSNSTPQRTASALLHQPHSLTPTTCCPAPSRRVTRFGNHHRPSIRAGQTRLDRNTTAPSRQATPRHVTPRLAASRHTSRQLVANTHTLLSGR